MRLLLFVFGLPVLAHTLYFLPSRFHVTRGERLVFSIHNGDAFPASEDAVAPERILDVRLIGTRGSAQVTDFQQLGKATYAVVPVEQEGAHWLTIRTKPNLLELEAAKFESVRGPMTFNTNHFPIHNIYQQEVYKVSDSEYDIRTISTIVEGLKDPHASKCKMK